MSTHLGQERVSRGSGMELGDEIDFCTQRWSRAAHRQRLVAQVFINVPHPQAAAFCRRSQQTSTTIAEAEPREPPPDREAIALRDGRLVPLENDRVATRRAADPQPVDSS